MKNWNPDDYSDMGLLELFADILDVLQKRGVVHSTNNPVANYSEKLVTVALRLKPMPESTKGYDAVDSEGMKYEIKGRRPTAKNPSRQLSMLRELEKHHFDYLVGIIFHENFKVMKGCIVPHNIVIERSRFTKHANAHIFQLTDDIWRIDGVKDITKQLCETQNGEQPT
jgi:hypothetical protein